MRMEAYIGGSTTKETRKMAEEAVTLIHQHLKNAYDDGHNKEARKGMLKAAYCAGVAFTKSYVGYVHAVAHSLADSMALRTDLPMRLFFRWCFGCMDRPARKNWHVLQEKQGLWMRN